MSLIYFTFKIPNEHKQHFFESEISEYFYICGDNVFFPSLTTSERTGDIGGRSLLTFLLDTSTSVLLSVGDLSSLSVNGAAEGSSCAELAKTKKSKKLQY